MARTLRLRHHKFETGGRTLVMGVLNLTPDSFSGDGIYRDPERAADRAKTMLQEGADIIDVGGESTRPGAQPVSIQEEIERILPTIKMLAAAGVPLSVDTYKPEVAEQVLKLGADMINDVTGLADPRMTELVRAYESGIVIMHGWAKAEKTLDLLANEHGTTDQVKAYLETKIRTARKAGVKDDSMIIDPGIGFGKNPRQNMELIRSLASFKDLGPALMVGSSRKGFIGRTLDLPPDQRIEGTIATVVASVLNGADIVRVHDVKEVSRAVKLADAISRRPVDQKKALNLA